MRAEAMRDVVRAEDRDLGRLAQPRLRELAKMDGAIVCDGACNAVIRGKLTAETNCVIGNESAAAAMHLHVHGDVTFGADVVVRGDVTVDGPAEVADGTVLEG